MSTQDSLNQIREQSDAEGAKQLDGLKGFKTQEKGLVGALNEVFGNVETLDQETKVSLKELSATVEQNKQDSEASDTQLTKDIEATNRRVDDAETNVTALEDETTSQGARITALEGGASTEPDFSMMSNAQGIFIGAVFQTLRLDSVDISTSSTSTTLDSLEVTFTEAGTFELSYKSNFSMGFSADTVVPIELIAQIQEPGESSWSDIDEFKFGGEIHSNGRLTVSGTIFKEMEEDQKIRFRIRTLISPANPPQQIPGKGTTFTIKKLI